MTETSDSNDSRYRYCPQCGGEYQRVVRTCVDCGIELTSTPPPKPAEEAVDHRVLTYRLALSRDEHDLLSRVLDGDDIAHQWTDGGELLVSAAREARVDELIESLGLSGVAPDRPLTEQETWATPGGGEALGRAGAGGCGTVVLCLAAIGLLQVVSLVVYVVVERQLDPVWFVVPVAWTLGFGWLGRSLVRRARPQHT